MTGGHIFRFFIEQYEARRRALRQSEKTSMERLYSESRSSWLSRLLRTGLSRRVEYFLVRLSLIAFSSLYDM